MASPAGQKNVFCFGLFEADPNAGELVKQGRHVRLQDQPFRMLILLLQQPGEVITRDELREKLWPQNTFVEFDNGLNVAVKKIRDALGDSAENPRFVETVPRRGYRFIAPVSIKASESIPQSAIAGETAEQPQPVPGVMPRHRTLSIFASLAGLVLLTVIAAFLFKTMGPKKREENSAAPPARMQSPSRRTVAVMEFQNVAGHPRDAWLATAIPEMLSTELGSGEKLRLIPAEDVARMRRELRLANSSSLARDTAVSAGKNLNADMLVVGSYTAMGSGPARRLRVDVRMQEAGTGEIVAEVAETADEQHLFELIVRAGTRLREALGMPGISPNEEASVRAALPSNPEASRLYAEGLARLRVLDAAGGRDLLQQAVAAEPKFPLSHNALASAWRTLGYDQKARDEAKKALDLSSHLPRTDRLLIEGRYRELSGEMDQAISAYRALFALFPDSLEDGLMLAEAQAWAGKPADALATLEALRKLPEPLSRDPRIDLRQAATMSLQGEGADARLAILRRAEEKARVQGAHLLVAKAQVMECSALLFEGHNDEATRTCEEAQRAFTAAGNAADAAQTIRFLGDIRMRQGRLQEGLDLFAEALKINERARDTRGTAVTLNEMALVHENRGDLKEAENLYRRSYLLFVKLGHTKNAAVLASNVGGTLLQQGKLAESESMFRRSLELARESGSRDAEATANRSLAELSLVRGRLDDAVRHSETAKSLDATDPVANVESFVRLGRILAVRGDLPGARADQQQALSIAEKTGGKGQAAQSRMEIAQIDLEEGHAAQTEQTIRDALEVFKSEKMLDDELNAQVQLSRCLLFQGKKTEAKGALDLVRDAVTRHQNAGSRLMFRIADARLKAAGGAPGSRTQAKADLLQAIDQARQLGFTLMDFEARLAVAEIECAQKTPLAAKTAESLQREAEARGFGLIARKAASTMARTFP